jgi:predicted methyltransferase
MVKDKQQKPIVITQFKWSGKLGPFRIKSSCGQCDLTTTILKSMMEREFKGKNVNLEIKPWLDNLFYCLFRGAWHAPIVMVNGRKFHQYSRNDPMFDRRKLAEAVQRLSVQ